MASISPPMRRISLLGSGIAQFSGQCLGLLLAVLVSHLIARRMGIGPEADAFILGRRLITAVTETLNQIMVAVFIPLIAGQMAAGSGTWTVLLRSGGGALLVGVAMAIGLVAGAPWIVASVAPNFDTQTTALAIRVMEILALALPVTIVTVALSAYCNVWGRFGGAAAIRQLPRAAVALTLLVGTGGLALLAANAYVLGTVLVACLMLLMALQLRAAAARPTEMKPSASTSRRGSAALVLTCGAMVVLWLETAFAARTGAGAVAMLEYAQRLGALLGNTIGIALSLVVFADLSRRSAAGESADLDHRFCRALMTGLALMLPPTVGVIANAPGIVELVLGYGAFDLPEIRDQVTGLTRWMAAAPLGAFALRMMYVRVLADGGQPIVRIVLAGTFAEIAIRVVLFKALVPWLGLAGVPVGLVFAPIVPLFVVGLWLRRCGVSLAPNALLESGPLVGASVAASSAIVAGTRLGAVLAEWLGLDPKAAVVAGLLTSCLGGAIVVGVATAVLRVRLR